MPSGDKLALGAMAALAAVAAMSQRRRQGSGYELKTLPFDPEEGLPTVGEVPARIPSHRWRMIHEARYMRPNEYVGATKVIDSEAMDLWYEGKGEGSAEQFYWAIEDSVRFIYIPQDDEDTGEDEGGELGKALDRARFEFRIPSRFPSSRVGEVVDALKLDKEDLRIAMFLDEIDRPESISEDSWLTRFLWAHHDSEEYDSSRSVMMNMLWDLLNEEGKHSDWERPETDVDIIREAGRDEDDPENKLRLLFAAIESGDIPPSHLDKDAVATFFSKNKDALVEIIEDNPHIIETRAVLGRPIPMLAGTRIDTLLGPEVTREVMHILKEAQ
jgi:hypothetical protein